MSHVRQQIREAFFAVLDGIDITGTEIKVNRLYPTATTPNLTIRTGRDDMEEETGGGNQTRVLKVYIEARSKLDERTDDELDSIASEVEVAIESDFSSENGTLRGLLEAVDYVGSDPDFSDQQEKEVGLLVIEYDVLYRVNKSDPTEVID